MNNSHITHKAYNLKFETLDKAPFKKKLMHINSSYLFYKSNDI